VQNKSRYTFDGIVFPSINKINIMTEEQKNTNNSGTDKLKNAGTGNASNPPAENDMDPQKNQLLDEQAETYLREGGNIEDMPDENDWKDANKTIKNTEGKK
jgi:hypothetical protein